MTAQQTEWAGKQCPVNHNQTLNFHKVTCLGKEEKEIIDAIWLTDTF